MAGDYMCFQEKWMENNTTIATIYARAKGIERAMAQIPPNAYIRPTMGRDINSCANMLSQTTGEDCSYIIIQECCYQRDEYGGWFLRRQIAESRILQLVNILENVYGCGEKGLEAGLAYNFLQDTTLKSRCSDLLSAKDHFDRVINQATQVFEDRIREISGLTDCVGAELICKAIGGDPNKIIIFSKIPLSIGAISKYAKG